MGEPAAGETVESVVLRTYPEPPAAVQTDARHDIGHGQPDDKPVVLAAFLITVDGIAQAHIEPVGEADVAIEATTKGGELLGNNVETCHALRAKQIDMSPVVASEP